MESRAAGRRLIDTFQSVRIVNLAHRTDRRREMRAQLHRLGLDDSTPQVAFFPAASFADANGFPTAGTRGCYHSHLGVLEEALAAGRECVLILEDDLNFADGVEQSLVAAIDALADRPWSIFYGGALQWEERAAERPIFAVDPERAIMGGHFVAFRGEAIPRAVALLRSMSERAPGDPRGGPMHVDGAYTWLRRLNPDLITVMANPMLGYQRSSKTDIHDLRFYDTVPVVKQSVALLRKLRNYATR